MKFLLGLGAQKAGSTWLFEQLRAHPEIAVSWKKEIRLWDRLFDKSLSGMSPVEMFRHRQKFVMRFPSGRKIPILGVFRSRLEKEYFDAMRSLRDSESVVMDISPAYSGLSQHRLHYIRRRIVEHGFEPKAFFAMRDPVERVISGIAQSLASRQRRDPEKLINAIEERFDSHSVRARTQYELIVPRLEAVFSPIELKISDMRTQFESGFAEDFCGWLGVQTIAFDATSQYAHTQRTTEIPADLIARIRSYYSSTYDFLEQHHPSVIRTW